MQQYQMAFDESERQMILLALAHLAVERPGWKHLLRDLALRMDRKEDMKTRQIAALRGERLEFNIAAGDPITYELFRQMRHATVLRYAKKIPNATEEFPWHRVVILPPKMPMEFPITTEENAREMIRTGQAGYWELSLRDSISKTPIAHPEQTIIFVQDEWYIVPKSAFSIESKGRVGNEAMNCKLDMISVTDDALQEAIQDEMIRKGKQLPMSVDSVPTKPANP